MKFLKRLYDSIVLELVIFFEIRRNREINRCREIYFDKEKTRYYNYREIRTSKEVVEINKA